jgi:hypothetical protein
MSMAHVEQALALHHHVDHAAGHYDHFLGRFPIAEAG